MAVRDGGGQENRQPEVCAVLVFHRAGDGDVLISRPPVERQVDRQPFNAFCDKEKTQIGPCTDHLPGFYTPVVGLLEQKVGGEAGVDGAARRDTVGATARPGYRQAEAGGFGGNGGVSPVAGVAPVDIAVLTAGTDFVAAVPRIPGDRRHAVYLLTGKMPQPARRAGRARRPAVSGEKSGGRAARGGFWKVSDGSLRAECTAGFRPRKKLSGQKGPESGKAG